MSANYESLLPPDTPEEFESLCLDLWKELCSDPGAQKNGRRGQNQDGVDVFAQHEGKWIGIQCKRKDGLLRTKVSSRELEHEVKAALRFKPKLSLFILATTGPRDASVQKLTRELSEEHKRQGLFAIEVWSWEDIREEFTAHRELRRRILQKYYRHLRDDLELRDNELGPRIAPTRLRVTGDKFVGRTNEIEMLDTAWDSSDDYKTNIVSLIGQGGEGKTAIVLDWYARSASHRWRGARRVFDWSFYSQGTSAQSAPSTDEFFNEAFKWFGHTGEVSKDPWVRGEKLGELIAAERTLLVLDGLEPLQQPPGDYGGEFKDPSVKALLRKLAMHNPGLCVLTSRTDITDLKDFEHEGGSCCRHALQKLDLEAARQLLRDLGVSGPDTELNEAVKEFNGHAYNLNLLGNYLAKCTNDHDIAHWREVILLKEDEHIHSKLDLAGKKEGHGRRMLRAYERWFGPDSAAGAILRLLGLFDRPARSDLLDELRAMPAIPELTETLVDLPESDWLRMLDQLQHLGLIKRELVSAPPSLRTSVD